MDHDCNDHYYALLIMNTAQRKSLKAQMPRTRILNNLFTCTSYCMSLRMYIVTADRMFTPDKCKKWRFDDTESGQRARKTDCTQLYDIQATTGSCGADHLLKDESLS